VFVKERPFPFEGLPAVFARRGESTLRALGALEDPVLATCAALAQVASERKEGQPGAAGIARAIGFAIAAVHAAARFSPPHEAMPEGEVEAIAPREWLLVAATERARAPLPPAIGAALDRMIASLGEVVATPAKMFVPADSPALDYGLGLILPALLGRTEDDAAAQAGRALGRLLRVTCEVRALGGRGPDAPLPQLLGRIAEDAGLGERFARTIAHAGKPEPERLPLLSLLGGAALAAPVKEALGSLVGAVKRASTPNDVLSSAADELGAEASQATSGARFFGLMPRKDEEPAELERAIALGREALLADPELREAWEIQRWGGYFEQARVARLFPVGLCTLALHAAGVDVRDRIASLLALGEPDGFRYFEGYARIPPDADDLGLALQLAARSPDPASFRETFAWPVELCVRNTDADGAMHVWFYRDLREPVPEGAPSWLGTRCVAAAAGALIGLAEAGSPLPEGFFDRALAWIVRRWAEEGPKASFFYAAPYARLVLARLANAVERVPGDPAPRALLRAKVDAIEAEIVASMRVDGGFGDELSTAAHLGVLAIGRRRTFDPWPSVTYLAARQGYDGLFPRAPLYRTPGKDNTLSAHGSRALTTAVCLEALVTTRARVKTMA